MTSPRDAVRAELRAALYDLSDALLEGGTRMSIDGALENALSLASRAHEGAGPPLTVLSDLQRDLRALAIIDFSWYAQQITHVADRL